MNHIGEISAILAATAWSVNTVVMEKHGTKLTSMAINFLRTSLGFVALTCLILLLGSTLLPAGVSPEAWAALLSSGLIGFAVGDTFLMAAVKNIGSRVTFLIYSFSPVITGILGYLLFQEKMSILSLIGTAVILAGVVIVIFQGDLKGLRLNYSKRGILDAFIAAAGQSVGVILSKFGSAQLDSLAATQIRLLGGLLGLLVLFLTRHLWAELKPVLTDRGSQVVTLSTSLLGTVVGVVLSMIAIKNTQAAIASILMSIMPVIIIPLSVLFLKEKIKPREVLGALLTVIGVSILFL